jgi:hypothetical protein
MNVEICDSNDVQYTPAARGLKFSKIWQAGEDLTLGFVLDRSSSLDWPDIGYGYQVILRNGLTARWQGYVRGIEQGEDEIAITALGTWVILDDFPYIGGGSYPGTKGRLWCDTRYGKWSPTTADQYNKRNPEKYQMDTQNRIFIAPRKNETFGTPDEHQGSLHYICLFNDVARITFSYDVKLPTSWRAQVSSWAGDWTGETTEWTKTAVTESGAGDITLVAPRAIVAFELFFTAAEAQYTGETGETCYAKFTSVKAYGTADTSPTITDVAGDIVDQLQAGTDIENSKTEIETINLTLEPFFFENGEKCLQALEDAASFGDANNKAIAWGVESGGSRVFVRAPDRESVRYIVPPQHCVRLSARGDTSRDYYSAATGRYTDEEGVTQFTDKYYAHVTSAGIVANTTSTGDDLASVIFDVQRETVQDFGRVSATLATEFIKQFVIEHGHPQVFSSVEVIGQVQDLHMGGAWIQPYECGVGYLVQIPHFRAVEAEGASGTDLREWDTTFMLAGLEWDKDRSVCKLIPEGAASDLKMLMDFARRFGEQQAEELLQKRGEVLGM